MLIRGADGLSVLGDDLFMDAPVPIRLLEDGGRPQGHLFVHLQPSDDIPSAAEDLLIRFTRVWTPDRLAA